MGSQAVMMVREGHLKRDLKRKKLSCLPWEYPKAKYSFQLITQRWEYVCAWLKDRGQGGWGRGESGEEKAGEGPDPGSPC